MATRAKKKNLFGARKALTARQTTPASGGMSKHARRGTARQGESGSTVGNYAGYRIWKDADGEYRFSGDPQSAFASVRAVKAHIDWLKKGRGNPKAGKPKSERPMYSVDVGDDHRLFPSFASALKYENDLKREGIFDAVMRKVEKKKNDAVGVLAGLQVAKELGVSPGRLLANPLVEGATADSEIPLFRAGAAGYPGVDYLIAYPELNQAVAYAQAVRAGNPDVEIAVVCLEAAAEADKLPGGDYAVTLEVEKLRELEAGQVGAALVPNPSDEIWSVNRHYVVRLWSNDGRKWDAHLYGDKGEQYLSNLARGVTEKTARKKAVAALASRGGGAANPVSRSHAHLKGYEDGAAHVGYLPDDQDLVRQAGRRGYRSTDDVGEYVRGFKEAMQARRRRNPEEPAALAYEKFHGRPADRVIEITEELHGHEWLAEIGPLVNLQVETPTGLMATLEFVSDPPRLAFNEEPENEETGPQLFIEDGNQAVDLKPLKMDGADWRKESMVLGWIWLLTYQTEKSFDKFETIDYYHKLSEEERGSMEKRRKTLPSLRYDTVNKKLFIDGGKYRIRLPLFGVSPGIEN